MTRPEHSLPPELFYNKEEAEKYNRSTRIQKIQKEMTERCIELLGLDDKKSHLILDVGCGTCISGDVIEQKGHEWVGIDISINMLEVAKESFYPDNLFLSDIGNGLFFRSGSFDGVISISALQWLFYSNKTSENPRQRLKTFFSSLISCLSLNSSAAFQFYPENTQQSDLALSIAKSVGFYGTLITDNPESNKNMKKYLLLTTDSSRRLVDKPRLDKHNNKKQTKKEWVQDKKEKRRNKGKVVSKDSAYSGRKRRPKF
eukprot:GHVP01053795.1.p1 GENE.GHVP01053795.1~~GHVP01053795.1.p1  ORF type:complete len:258 (+),score=53.44 GHVP01053795.1:1222-1995(+)